MTEAAEDVPAAPPPVPLSDLPKLEPLQVPDSQLSDIDDDIKVVAAKLENRLEVCAEQEELELDVSSMKGEIARLQLQLKDMKQERVAVAIEEQNMRDIAAREADLIAAIDNDDRAVR